MRLRSASLLVLAPALLVAPAAQAGWLGPHGTPVASASHGFPVAMCSDGAGGVLVAFQGLGVPGGSAIRLQRVTADGEVAPGWPSNGVVACSLATTAAQGVLRAVSDGAGGAYLLWLEGTIPRYFASGTAYVQHILASGVRPATGWPPRGRLLGTAGPPFEERGQRCLSALPDGEGGVIASWEENRDGEVPDIRVTRKRANGANAVGFPSEGLVVSEPLDPAIMRLPALRSDGVSGYWLSYSVVSSDTLVTPSSNRLVRLLPDGQPDPAWAGNGFAPGAPSAGLNGGTVPLADGEGGAYLLVTAGENRPARLYHVLGDLTLDPSWPAEGLLLGVGTAGWEGDNYQLASDGAGGIFAAWPKRIANSTSLLLRRVHANGALDDAWPAPQDVIGDWACTLLADPGGVFFSGTFNYACVHNDCYGASAIGRRSSAGSIPTGWDAVPISFFTQFPGQYALPPPDSALGGPVAMVADGAAGVFAAWTIPDEPYNGWYGGPGTVRVMRFAAQGPVADVPKGGGPHGRELLARWLAHQGILVTTPAWAAGARLEVCDVAGRRVADAEVVTSAAGSEWTVPGTSALATGLYFLRLRTAAGDAGARVVVAH